MVNIPAPWSIWVRKHLTLRIDHFSAATVALRALNDIDSTRFIWQPFLRQETSGPSGPSGPQVVRRPGNRRRLWLKSIPAISCFNPTIQHLIMFVGEKQRGHQAEIARFLWYGCCSSKVSPQPHHAATTEIDDPLVFGTLAAICINSIKRNLAQNINYNYHLVMTNIAMENHHAIKFGKPSISMGHLYHSYDK